MRHLARILGMASIAALSLLGVSAVGAHALPMELEAGGKILTGLVLASGTSTAKSKFLVLNNSKLEILCDEVKLHATLENKTNSIHGTILQLWHKCHLPNSANCTIYPTEKDALNKTNKGLIHLEALVLLGVLNGGNLYAVSTGLGAGNTFSTIYAGEEGGCTLPFEFSLGGKTAMKIINGSTSEKEHELVDTTKAQEEALGVKMAYGEEAMECDWGAEKAALGGVAHAGLSYRLTP